MEVSQPVFIDRTVVTIGRGAVARRTQTSSPAISRHFVKYFSKFLAEEFFDIDWTEIHQILNLDGTPKYRRHLLLVCWILVCHKHGCNIFIQKQLYSTKSIRPKLFTSSISSLLGTQAPSPLTARPRSPYRRHW